MKNFISVADVTNMDHLIKQALMYKKNPYADKMLGLGKKIGLLFLNPSLRTRFSTQVAALNFGLEPLVFNVDKEGWALEFEEEAIMSGNSVDNFLLCNIP